MSDAQRMLFDISIHTFLAEGDEQEITKKRFGSTISIHTFLAEGDLNIKMNLSLIIYFNPHLHRGR